MAKEQQINEIDKAMRESNLHVLDNQHLIKHLISTIKSRGSIMFIGPRGCGKTSSAKQAVAHLGMTEVYWNLSTKERVDVGGYPDMFNSKNDEFVNFKFINDVKPLIYGGDVPPFITVINAKSDELSLEVQSQLNTMITWTRKFPQIKELEIEAHSVAVGNAVLAYLQANGLSQKIVVDVKEKANAFVKFTVVKNDPVDCVLILDEVDKADSSLWGPLLEIVQMHSINGKKLPYLRSVIMTGNMIHEGGKRPILPLLDRCEAYMIRPSLDGFVEYSNTVKRIHPSVMSFLKDNPSALFENSDIENHYKDSTPRSLEYCSDLCYEFEHRKEDERFSGHEESLEKGIFNARLLGFLGTQVGQSLIIYFEHYMDFLPVIRPIFDAIEDLDRKKAMTAVDKSLETIKKFESSTKTLVLFMTIMHNYVNHINTMIAKYKSYNSMPFAKLAASQKKELDALNEQTTILIDAIGYFFYRASSDVVSTSAGGNDATLINGDLLCAILRNGVTQAAKWQEYVAGTSYMQYLNDFVKRNNTRPEFSYKNYPNVNMKKMLRSSTSDAVSFALFDHYYWHGVLTQFSESQKMTIDKLKSLYGSK